MPSPDFSNPEPSSLPRSFDPAKLKEARKAMEEMKRRGLLPAGVELPDFDQLEQFASGGGRPVGRKDPKGKTTKDVVAPNTDFCQTYAVPESRKAMILTAGISDELSFPDDLKAMLESRGYIVDSRRRMTLNLLRNLPDECLLPGEQIGVLVFVGHSSSGETGPQRFSLVVERELAMGSPAHKRDLEDEHEELVKSGAQESTVLDKDLNLPALGEDFLTWSANINFFFKYWAGKKFFSANSLVYFASCDVACQDFIDMLRYCGVGNLIAWDNPIAFGLAEKTGRFMFDRLLGADQDHKPHSWSLSDFRDPVPQRPLVWSEIKPNMRFHDSGYGIPLDGPFTNQNGNHLTHLTVFADNGAGACLTPSIHELFVDEKAKELVISGWLGPDPKQKGHVWLQKDPRSCEKALELKVKPGRWDGAALTVTCELPTHGQLTAGYIVVEVDGRRSNAVPLTEWIGELSYTAYGDETLKEEGRLSFRLRMGAHNPRRFFNQPFGEASYEPSPIPSAYAAPDSSLTVEASGSAHYHPPQSGLVAQSVKGQFSFPPASALPEGRSGAGQQCFDVVLGLRKILGTPPRETMEATWLITLPSSLANNATTQHEWKTTSENGLEETNWLSILPGMISLKNLHEQKNLTSYDLPVIEFLNENCSAPWKVFTVRLTSKVNYAPDWARGEDYSTPSR